MPLQRNRSMTSINSPMHRGECRSRAHEVTMCPVVIKSLQKKTKLFPTEEGQEAETFGINNKQYSL